jgi:hypothetical protein
MWACGSSKSRTSLYAPLACTRFPCQMRTLPKCALKEDKSAKLAKRQRLRSTRHPSSKSGQEETGSNRNSDCSRDDELDNTDAEADEAEERSRPAKRKRPSSSHAGPAKKKHYLQQCSTSTALHAPVALYRGSTALARPFCSRRRHLTVVILTDCPEPTYLR